MQSIDAGASPAWRQIEQWIGESQEILGRAIPSLFQECNGLRQKAEAAEERWRQLSREIEDLQGEVTKLRGEIDALRRQRAEMAAAMERGLTEIGRLTNEALLKLRGH